MQRVNICSVDPSFSIPLQFALACCQSTSWPHPDWWLPILALSMLGVCQNLWGFVCLRINLKFSLALWSGEFPGHGPKMSMFCCPSHLVITVALWQGAPLFWKGQCSSPNCSWMVGRSFSRRMFWYHSWFMAIQNCEWALSLSWEATPHMNGLRMLHCWHDTGLMVTLTFSSPDKLLSRCPKPSERGFIRENDFTPFLSSPIPVPFEEYSLLSFLTPGHPPKVFASLCVPMHSYQPADIPEQALHWWCRDLVTESTLGDGPGTAWTFFGALKPSSQQLNLSPWSCWWSDKWLI